MKRILLAASLILGLAGIAGADTTLLDDTFTDTNGVVISSHTPDTNNTGDVYHALNGSISSTYGDIQGNLLRITYAAGNRDFPKYFMNIGYAPASGTITYRFMAKFAGTRTSSPQFAFLSSRTGANVSGTSLTAYAVNLDSEDGPTNYLNLWGTTLNAEGIVSQVTLTGFSGYTLYPVKITTNGNSICVYCDNTGTEATTLRIYYPTTLNNSNTEIAFLANHNQTPADSFMDSLNISINLPNTPTPTATPTPTPTPTPFPTGTIPKRRNAWSMYWNTWGW
jgi:hypothetical protein